MCHVIFWDMPNDIKQVNGLIRLRTSFPFQNFSMNGQKSYFNLCPPLLHFPICAFPIRYWWWWGLLFLKTQQLCHSSPSRRTVSKICYFLVFNFLPTPKHFCPEIQSCAALGVLLLHFCPTAQTTLSEHNDTEQGCVTNQTQVTNYFSFDFLPGCGSPPGRSDGHMGWVNSALCWQ